MWDGSSSLIRFAGRIGWMICSNKTGDLNSFISDATNNWWNILSVCNFKFKYFFSIFVKDKRLIHVILYVYLIYILTFTCTQKELKHTNTGYRHLTIWGTQKGILVFIYAFITFMDHWWIWRKPAFFILQVSPIDTNQ